MYRSVTEQEEWLNGSLTPITSDSLLLRKQFSSTDDHEVAAMLLGRQELKQQYRRWRLCVRNTIWVQRKNRNEQLWTHLVRKINVFHCMTWIFDIVQFMMYFSLFVCVLPPLHACSAPVLTTGVDVYRHRVVTAHSLWFKCIQHVAPSITKIWKLIVLFHLHIFTPINSIWQPLRV